MYASMSLPSHNAYLQAEVLSASPARLVEILYDLGISSIESAKACLREQDIIGRGRFVTKAFEVLVELTNSLNFEASPEFSANYARLYDYCQRRLLQAHAEQSEHKL